MSERVVVYPGSFDPVTLGHLDVARRAARLFDWVIVAVASREEKHPLFSWEERIALAREACSGIERVEVQGFDCLLVELARKTGAGAIVRGLRAVMDFDYEFQMALTNRKLAPEVETVFFAPTEKFVYLSASLVRELASKGGELGCFVPESVARALGQKFGPGAA